MEGKSGRQFGAFGEVFKNIANQLSTGKVEEHLGVLGKWPPPYKRFLTSAGLTTMPTN